MTAACATIVGIVLQLLGACYLVVQAWRTSRKLANFKVVYDTIATSSETLAQELAGQFMQQLIGFLFVLVGSGFQLYAVVAS